MKASTQPDVSKKDLERQGWRKQCMRSSGERGGNGESDSGSDSGSPGSSQDLSFLWNCPSQVLEAEQTPGRCLKQADLTVAAPTSYSGCHGVPSSSKATLFLNKESKEATYICSGNISVTLK